ncbi:hypothetical protein OHA27_38135 [Streptomyces sp. NBC_01619]|nr:hypothetical protein [Streptomyces sp. NBC_01619]
MVFLAGATMAVSACSANESKDADHKASATPSAVQSSKPADPAETAKKEAIGTYEKYWQEMERLYADSKGKSSDLAQYAASAALSNAEADAKQMHGKGLIVSGEVTVGRPTVTNADLNRMVPNVTLSSCLDVSRWRVLDQDTKKPAALPSTRLTKYVITSTIERWPQGWRVIRDEPQAKAC